MVPGVPEEFRTKVEAALEDARLRAVECLRLGKIRVAPANRVPYHIKDAERVNGNGRKRRFDKLYCSACGIFITDTDYNEDCHVCKNRRAVRQHRANRTRSAERPNAPVEREQAGAQSSPSAQRHG